MSAHSETDWKEIHNYVKMDTIDFALLHTWLWENAIVIYNEVKHIIRNLFSYIKNWVLTVHSQPSMKRAYPATSIVLNYHIEITEIAGFVHLALRLWYQIGSLARTISAVW